MKLVVKGVNLTVTPSLRRYVEEKIVRPAERLLRTHQALHAATLDLELMRGGRHHRKGSVWEAAANLKLPQQTFWQKTSGQDIRAAIDELEELLKRDITKYKERSRSRLLRGARRAKKDLHLARSARLYRKGRIREEGS